MSRCFKIQYLSHLDDEEYIHVVEGDTEEEAIGRLERLADLNGDRITVQYTEGPIHLYKYFVQAYVKEIK